MMIRAGKIPTPATAFTSLRPRRPRKVDGGHLKFIRSLPCVVCLSRNNIQAAHIRSLSLAYGKRDTGIGEKSSDRWSLPCCAEHHDAQHRTNELAFWAGVGVDPFKTAAALFSCSGDEEAAEVVIRMARVRP